MPEELTPEQIAEQAKAESVAAPEAEDPNPYGHEYSQVELMAAIRPGAFKNSTLPITR